MDNMADACIRRGGRADACRFPRIAVGPTVYGRPFWKLKKYLATLPPDTVSLFSPEEIALNRQRTADLRDWSVAVGAAMPAVGESQSPQDGGGGREEAANDGMMRRAA